MNYFYIIVDQDSEEIQITSDDSVIRHLKDDIEDQYMQTLLVYRITTDKINRLKLSSHFADAPICGFVDGEPFGTFPD